MPHAQLVDVAGAGHMVAGDRNDLFNDAVVNFLDTVRGQGARSVGPAAGLPAGVTVGIRGNCSTFPSRRRPARADDPEEGILFEEARRMLKRSGGGLGTPAFVMAGTVAALLALNPAPAHAGGTSCPSSSGCQEPDNVNRPSGATTTRTQSRRRTTSARRTFHAPPLEPGPRQGTLFETRPSRQCADVPLGRDHQGPALEPRRRHRARNHVEPRVRRTRNRSLVRGSVLSSR